MRRGGEPISVIVSCGITQAGTVKRINEDSFKVGNRIYPDTLNSREQKLDRCDDYWQLFSVTDGMGGAGVGDISSRLVQSYLIERSEDFSSLDPYNFNFRSYMQNFLDQADFALQERLRKHSQEAVGCSLALLLFSGERCYAMSVGNCRIYLYREGRLYRMTEDSVCPDLPLERRPLLFLGNHPGVDKITAQNLKQMIIQPGDHFFLCTDGVTDSLSDEDIQWVLDKPSPLQDYVESLFQNARRYDARDNQTILGLRVESRRIFDAPDVNYGYETDLAFRTQESPLFNREATREIQCPQSRQRTDQATLAQTLSYSQLVAEEAMSATRPLATRDLGSVRFPGSTQLRLGVGSDEYAAADYHREVEENRVGLLLVRRLLSDNLGLFALALVLLVLLIVLLSL